MADRKITLPRGIAGVSGGEALADRKARRIALARTGEIALFTRHIAELIMAHRDFALTIIIIGVGNKNGLRCDQPRLIMRPRGGQLPFGNRNIAKCLLGNHPIPIIPHMLQSRLRRPPCLRQ